MRNLSIEIINVNKKKLRLNNWKDLKGYVQAQIGGHSVDMPVSNPFLTDKIIDEEMTPMFDHQINDKRKWWRF